MGLKELTLDSIVTNTECNLIKSLKIKVTFADHSSKESQFAQGDNIAVKIVKNGRLLLLVGDVSKINSESEPYFVLDMSKAYKSYNEKIFPSEVRDISNLTSPLYDTNYDADGNIILPTTDSETIDSTTIQ